MEKSWNFAHNILYEPCKAIVQLQRRKCDVLPWAYNGRSLMTALETGPIGTRFQSSHHATTFVSL